MIRGLSDDTQGHAHPCWRVASVPPKARVSIDARPPVESKHVVHLRPFIFAMPGHEPLDPRGISGGAPCRAELLDHADGELARFAFGYRGGRQSDVATRPFTDDLFNGAGVVAHLANEPLEHVGRIAHARTHGRSSNTGIS